MSNALDDLLDNEHAQLHGETLTHPSGRTSRVTREKDARAELRRLRAIEDAASAFIRRSRDSWTQHDELFEALVGVLERSGS